MPTSSKTFPLNPRNMKISFAFNAVMTSFIFATQNTISHARLSRIGYNRSCLSMVQKSSTKRSNVITIRASDVSAIIGKNRFKGYDEIFDEMWKRHSPSTFVGETKDDIATKAVEKCDETEKLLLASTAAYVAVDATDAKSQFAETEKVIAASPNLSQTDKVVLLDQLKSQVFTAHGIRSESKTADLIEEKEGIQLLTDSKFYNFPLCVIDGKRFQVSGTVDRIERIGDEIILIEIKNRMRKLFTSVPEYEYIQVQTYLQIIPMDIQRAKLIQQYQDETSTTIIERDDLVWRQEILPGLLDFCTKFHSKISAEIKQ